MSNLYKVLEEAKVEEGELRAIFRICEEAVNQFAELESIQKINVAIIEHHRLECDSKDCDAEQQFKEQQEQLDGYRKECEQVKSFMRKLKPILE